MFYNIFIIVSLLFGLINSKPSIKTTKNYCYTTDEQPYLLFSTITAYDYTHGDLKEDSVEETCTPLQFFALNRHGTRYPSVSEITNFSKLGTILKQVITNYEDGKGSLCQEDFDLLKSWEWDANITPSKANDLVEQGSLDLAGIAKRYKEKFPELFITPYKEENYYFQFTETDRTRDSFEAYAEGLFENKTGVNYVESNDVIKPYKTCTSWHDQNNNTEYNSFLQTSTYQEMLQNVSQRLGFTQSLNASTIQAIYSTCAFEKAWYINKTSKWCAVFTEADLLVLEYSQDLHYYYKSGYAREQANKALGCPILKELFTRFQNTVTGNGGGNEAQVAVYFSHSTALHQFMLSLDLFKDEKELTALNYLEQSGRKWRSSIFGPFATNVAVLLYNCSNTEDPYQIEVFVNERSEEICSGKKLCSWTEFVTKFNLATLSCNLNFCTSSSSGKLSLHWFCFSLILFSLLKMKNFH